MIGGGSLWLCRLLVRFSSCCSSLSFVYVSAQSADFFLRESRVVFAAVVFFPRSDLFASLPGVCCQVPVRWSGVFTLRMFLLFLVDAAWDLVRPSTLVVKEAGPAWRRR